MKPNQKILLLSSVGVLPFTLIIFQVIPGLLGVKFGYLLGFVCYWLYSASFILIQLRNQPSFLASILRDDEKSKVSILYKLAAFLPVLGVFFITFLPNVPNLSVQTGFLVLIVAGLNGFIEELYWRGLYLRNFKDSWLYGCFLSTILFGAWHFSLWFIRGMEYHGGWPALVGGAFTMGLLWSVISRKINSVRIGIIAHVMVNVFAFTGLFVENGF